MKDDKQETLFDKGEWWDDDWQDMPEFVQEDLNPWKTVYIHFANREDMLEFSKLIDQTITMETKSLWYPKLTITKYIDKMYVDEENES